MNKCLVLLLAMLSMTLVHVVNVQPVRTVGIVYIKADGSVDPSTANIMSLNNVTYTITGDIDATVFVERNNTVLDGAGFTVTAGGILLYYVNNVTITNVELHGGITLSGSSNCSIIGNNITDNQFGVELQYLSSYNRLIGNSITASSNNGISLDGSSTSNLISGNNITDNYRGIYLGSSHNNITGNTITGNSQYGILIDSGHEKNRINGNTITANGAGVTLDNSFTNSITENSIEDNADGISLLSASSNNNVSGNTITGNSGYGIYLSASSNNTIHENAITNNMFGISLGASSNNSISGNTITTNEKLGIYLAGWSSSNNISRNTVTANNPNGDIYLGGGIVISSPSNSISQNTISANRGYGIHLSGTAASNNTVSENSITANNDSGIALSTASNNVVSENNVTANKKHGIFLSGSSSQNSITGNSIIGNEFGVFFSASSNNRFYHNTLLNNAKLNCTENSVNVWDNNYPSGGNFWSSYTGIDTDGDGIGDTPYIIDENNQDRYPLVAPAVWNYTNSVPVVSGGTVNWVSLQSNSTISTFKFDQTRVELRFNVTGTQGTKGYCNATIPKQLMRAESGQWQVLVSGLAVTPTVTEDAANTYLYFTYNHSTRTVEIRGTNAGEPFQQPEPLPTAWIVAAITIAAGALATATGYLYMKRKK